MWTFSFLKRKQSGAELGIGFYEHLRKQHADGFPNLQRLVSAPTTIHSDAVRDESLYLNVFSYDLSVYLALGKTPAKAAVLIPFWQHIETWLHGEHVAALPERFVFAGGGPRVIPPEPEEISYVRLLRRVQDYRLAVTSPHKMGLNYSVAAVFANTCGVMDIVSMTAVSSWFSSFKIQHAQFIRGFRIVA